LAFLENRDSKNPIPKVELIQILYYYNYGIENNHPLITNTFFKS
jgi:hypothetical protein